MPESTYDTTIEVRQAEDKEKIIEALRKIPIIQAACERSGISRSTLYRWQNDDGDFTAKVSEAIAEGREFVNDMGEAQIIKLIKQEKLPAASFWLKHNSRRYGAERLPTSRITPVLSPKDAELFKKALSSMPSQKYDADNQ